MGLMSPGDTFCHFSNFTAVSNIRAFQIDIYIYIDQNIFEATAQIRMIRTSRLLEWWWDSCQECQRSRQWDNHRRSRSADQLCQSSPLKGLPWSPLSLDCNQFSHQTFLILRLASLRGRWWTSRSRGRSGGTAGTPNSLDRPRTDGTSFENNGIILDLKLNWGWKDLCGAFPTMAY